MMGTINKIIKVIIYLKLEYHTQMFLIIKFYCTTTNL